MSIIEPVLARDFLKTFPVEKKFEIVGYKQESKTTCVLLLNYNQKYYQDRFQGTAEDVMSLKMLIAGKKVNATLKADGSDNDLIPEIVSVEVL